MKRKYIVPVIDIIEFEPLNFIALSNVDVEVYEDEEYPIYNAL